MKFSKQLTLNFILGLLFVFFAAACSTDQPAQSTLVEGAPAPLPTPTGEAVAYGASLDEWSEAVDEAPIQAEEIRVEEPVEPAQNKSDILSESPSMGDAPTGELEPASSQSSLDAVEEPVEAAQTSSDDSAENASMIGTPITLADVVYQEILWDALVPPDFTADAIMAKYADELAKIEDGSPEANELFAKMQQEFNNAPINEALSDTMVRIPGFIAPLEFSDELITEFLLVPYFGACIHVPPPPANQTVLVNTGADYGIKPEDSYNPVWIMGRLSVEGASTGIGEAGYTIQDAIVEPYTGP